jgi:hypothetical protein
MTNGAFGSKKFLMVDGRIVGIVRPTRQSGSKAKYVKAIKHRIADQDRRVAEARQVKPANGFKGFVKRMLQRKGES